MFGSINFWCLLPWDLEITTILRKVPPFFQ